MSSANSRATRTSTSVRPRRSRSSFIDQSGDRAAPSPAGRACESTLRKFSTTGESPAGEYPVEHAAPFPLAKSASNGTSPRAAERDPGSSPATTTCSTRPAALGDFADRADESPGIDARDLLGRDIHHGFVRRLFAFDGCHVSVLARLSRGRSLVMASRMSSLLRSVRELFARSLACAKSMAVLADVSRPVREARRPWPDRSRRMRPSFSSFGGFAGLQRSMLLLVCSASRRASSNSAEPRRPRRPAWLRARPRVASLPRFALRRPRCCR